MNQKRYSKDLLQKFGMLNFKPISTPLETNAKTCAHEGKDLAYVMMYRQLVGSLIYLTRTRRDIFFCSWCDDSPHAQAKETPYGGCSVNSKICEKYN